MSLQGACWHAPIAHDLERDNLSGDDVNETINRVTTPPRPQALAMVPKRLLIDGRESGTEHMDHYLNTKSEIVKLS